MPKKTAAEKKAAREARKAARLKRAGKLPDELPEKSSNVTAVEEAAVDLDSADEKMGDASSDNETASDNKWQHIVVGIITDVSSVPKKKLTQISVDVGEETEVSIVSNAKHLKIGERVAVALAGAVIPVGAIPDEDTHAFKVKKQSVGGVKSEGTVCDGYALGWAGGSKGVAARIPDSFKLGERPPTTKPRW